VRCFGSVALLLRQHLGTAKRRKRAPRTRAALHLDQCRGRRCSFSIPFIPAQPPSQTLAALFNPLQSCSNMVNRVHLFLSQTRKLAASNGISRIPPDRSYIPTLPHSASLNSFQSHQNNPSTTATQSPSTTTTQATPAIQHRQQRAQTHVWCAKGPAPASVRRLPSPAAPQVTQPPRPRRPSVLRRAHAFPTYRRGTPMPQQRSEAGPLVG